MAKLHPLDVRNKRGSDGPVHGLRLKPSGLRAKGRKEPPSAARQKAEPVRAAAPSPAPSPSPAPVRAPTDKPLAGSGPWTRKHRFQTIEDAPDAATIKARALVQSTLREAKPVPRNSVNWFAIAVRLGAIAGPVIYILFMLYSSNFTVLTADEIMQPFDF